MFPHRSNRSRASVWRLVSALVLLVGGIAASSSPAFARNRFLTVTIVGNGTVLRVPDLPDYPDNSNVVVTAVPGTGYHFTSWSGDATGSTNPITVNMDDDRSIRATFTINSYTLAVATDGIGSVTETPNLASYTHGTTVQLVASAGPGYSFIGWSGDANGNANPLTLTMTGNKSIVAKFMIRSFLLSLDADGPGKVTADPSLPTYPSGTPVTLTATPDSGYRFVSWGGDLVGTLNPRTIVMDKDKSAIAQFGLNTVPVQLPAHFSAQAVTTGLNFPTGFAFLPDGRVLVVEQQTARIRLIVDGHPATNDPICVIDSVVSAGGEQGLLGITVDPGWPARPYVYVYYSALGNSLRLSRFTASGDLTNPASRNLSLPGSSRFDVLRDLPDVEPLHNGGTVRFGPDGMLYLGLGDDANACEAQDPASLAGVILRMDVSQLPPDAGGPPDRESLAPPDNPFFASTNSSTRLVWATGLRNPFRFHIDPTNGAIFIGDVGFSSFEEISLASGPGQNFGWPLFEASASFLSTCSPEVPGFVMQPPIYSYAHDGLNAAAVIGAGVYRGAGCATCFPSEYEGDYFFSDFYGGFLRRLTFTGGTWSIAPPVPGQPSPSDWAMGFDQTSDYLVGPGGALWYCRMSVDFQDGTGEIGRISYVPPVLAVGPDPTEELMFAPPYPTPSRGAVHFSYVLQTSAKADLAIFDMMGRSVVRLIPSSPQSAGRHTIAWDGRFASGDPAPAGIYFARLSAAGRMLTRRVVLAR